MSNYLALNPFKDSSIDLSRVLTIMSVHLLALDLRILGTLGQNISNYLALYPLRDSGIGLTRVLTNMQLHLLALYIRVLDTLHSI